MIDNLLNKTASATPRSSSRHIMVTENKPVSTTANKHEINILTNCRHEISKPKHFLTTTSSMWNTKTPTGSSTKRSMWFGEHTKDLLKINRHTDNHNRDFLQLKTRLFDSTVRGDTLPTDHSRGITTGFLSKVRKAAHDIKV